jgi:hypothetical protein
MMATKKQFIPEIVNPKSVLANTFGAELLEAFSRQEGYPAGRAPQAG